MGIDYISSSDVLRNVMSSNVQGGINLVAFKQIVQELVRRFKVQDGRYFVFLTLQEAEYLRCIIHSRDGLSSILNSEREKPLKTAVAMWIISNEEAILLDSTKNYVPCAPPQKLSMLNCARFVNSDMYFDSNSITVLLRNLEKNKLEEREGWWLDVRSCRRRKQVEVERTVPIYLVFHTATEFEFMEYRATISRIRLCLKDRGMLVFDAFRAFNSTNTGLISCSEMYGAMEYLGIKFVPDQIYSLVSKIAVSNTGLISYDDFKRVFRPSEEEMETHAIGSQNSATFEPIPLKPIPELADMRSARRAEESFVITASLLENFKIKVFITVFCEQSDLPVA